MLISQTVSVFFYSCTFVLIHLFNTIYSMFRERVGVSGPQEMRQKEKAPLTLLKGKEGKVIKTRTLFSTPDL